MHTTNGRIMTQTEKVDYILQGACKYFGFTLEELQIKTGSRSPIWEKKRYLIHILENYTSCNYYEIANLLGYATHVNVLYHLRRINEELSDKSYGFDKTKRVYNELLNYLQL